MNYGKALPYFRDCAGRKIFARGNTGCYPFPCTGFLPAPPRDNPIQKSFRADKENYLSAKKR